MDLSRKGVDDSKGLWCPHVTSPQLTSDISSRYSSSDPSATSLADHFYAFYPETNWGIKCLLDPHANAAYQVLDLALMKSNLDPSEKQSGRHSPDLQIDISGRHSVHLRGARVELVPISHSSSFETFFFWLFLLSLPLLLDHFPNIRML